MSALVSPLASRRPIHLFRDGKVVPPEPSSDNSPHGEISVGEISGEMYTMQDATDSSITKYLQLQGKIYPHVVVPDAPKVVSVTPIGAKVRQYPSQFKVWWAKAAAVMNIGELLGLNTPQEVDGEIKQSQYGLYEKLVAKLLTTFGISFAFPSRLYQSIPPTLRRPQEGAIVAFAWHKHKSRFSVGLRNDVVCIYELNESGGNWFPTSLQSEIQKDILCMEYKPLSGSTLAVGCRNGICVWDVASAPSQDQRTSPAGTPMQQTRELPLESAAWVNYLTYEGHAPVNCLAWCPNTGRLASGSINQGSVLIWDVALGHATPLHQVLLGGVVSLHWSPCGRFLFGAGVDGTYRVWETETWQDLKWVAGSVVQAACWSPCGNFLAVALVGEPVVMFYRIGTQLGEITSDEQAGIDFSPYTIKSKRGTAITVGGSIKDIAWDPTGARICVSFSNSEYIAVLNRVFETSITERSHLSLSPQGYIRGPGHGSSPVLMSFRSNIGQRALLSAVWPKSGKISFYPTVLSGAVNSN